MLRILFYLMIVKPLILLMLGLNIRGKEYLPLKGPAIIVANHNSHLDTMVLLSLFPLRLINKIRPVAAADYFLSNRLLKWFALSIASIIPLQRDVKKAGHSLFNEVLTALDNEAIIIIFPEGTRGEPEIMGKMKNGIGHLLAERPQVPVIPIFLYGLGKCLPKGEILLVPFFVDVFISKPLHWQGNRHSFMEQLADTMQDLQNQATLDIED